MYFKCILTYIGGLHINMVTYQYICRYYVKLCVRMLSRLFHTFLLNYLKVRKYILYCKSISRPSAMSAIAFRLCVRVHVTGSDGTPYDDLTRDFFCVQRHSRSIYESAAYQLSHTRYSNVRHTTNSIHSSSFIFLLCRYIHCRISRNQLNLHDALFILTYCHVYV